MKKLLICFLVFTILISVNTFALGEASYKFTMFKEDLSGTNYRVYLTKCQGHYSNGTVNLYITNTSKSSMKFQVTIGYSGASVQTSVESGYVEIPPKVTGRFELTDLDKYPEKTNDDLGYRPNSKLSGNSVVQIQVQSAFEGATFVVTGIDNFERSRNVNYSDFKNSDAIQRQAFVPAYVTQSKLVIKEEIDPDKESYEYTLQQPDSQTVQVAVKVIIASAIVCAGAITIYTVCHIKRRKKHD